MDVMQLHEQIQFWKDIMLFPHVQCITAKKKNCKFASCFVWITLSFTVRALQNKVLRNVLGIKRTGENYIMCTLHLIL